MAGTLAGFENSDSGRDLTVMISGKSKAAVSRKDEKKDQESIINNRLDSGSCRSSGADTLSLNGYPTEDAKSMRRGRMALVCCAHGSPSRCRFKVKRPRLLGRGVGRWCQGMHVSAPVNPSGD